MKKVCIWTLVTIGVLLLVFGALSLSSLIFMALWNWILPLFGVTTLTFWQSMGVVLLLGFISGGCNKAEVSSLKEDVKKLKSSVNKTNEEPTTESVPVEVKVNVTVDHPDDETVKVKAAINDTPMVEVPVVEGATNDTPSEQKQEIVAAQPAKKVSSRKKKPKKPKDSTPKAE